MHKTISTKFLFYYQQITPPLSYNNSAIPRLSSRHGLASSCSPKMAGLCILGLTGWDIFIPSEASVSSARLSTIDLALVIFMSSMIISVVMLSKVPLCRVEIRSSWAISSICQRDWARLWGIVGVLTDPSLPKMSGSSILKAHIIRPALLMRGRHCSHTRLDVFAGWHQCAFRASALCNKMVCSSLQVDLKGLINELR